MKNNTIREAIIKALSDNNEGLSPKEILDKINEQHLFTFHAKSPLSVLSSEIRKSCLGMDIKKARLKKDFIKLDNGKIKLNSTK